MSFESLGLEPDLLKAVAEQGYTEPTPIQRQSIPVALEGKDLVGSAQTGTGKTAAFLLPILQRLKHEPRGLGTRALILVPTRELAEQVLESAQSYGRHSGVTSASVYGGMDYKPQIKALKAGVDIVVATPGRLLDHIGRGNVDTSRLEVLVLDEADRMLDMGFAPDVHRILDTLPKERQTLFFSATISSEVDRLARHALNDHTAVEIGHRATAAEGVEHMLVAVDRSDKRAALAAMLDQIPKGRTLVFTRTKWGADMLSRYLRQHGHQVTSLHGDKTQQARNKALDRFKSGAAPILVATDVAARGIDVDKIVMVVNFDVPNEAEVYVHRVGRTARAGANGVALTLMAPHEWDLMRDIEKLMGTELRREIMPGFEPTVEPIQPEDRVRRQQRPTGPSIRSRRGGSRRRRA